MSTDKLWCNECDKEFDNIEYEYCPYCGEALDTERWDEENKWEDEEEEKEEETGETQ